VDIEVKSVKKKRYRHWIIPMLLLLMLAETIWEKDRVQGYYIKSQSFVEGLMDTARSKSLDNIGSGFPDTGYIGSLDKQIKSRLPSKPYIVISTTENRFSLRKPDGDTIRTGFCSTGKDQIMIKGEMKWVFKTPRGIFTIQNKLSGPVWTKPDWAFIEEGQPVPPKGSKERVDPYTLGDYALGLGSGYYIHGTLYQRRIGVPETHGCVRIGAADLEVIYKTLKVGSLVYIY
jgi:L,D-transpeptidase ErfK/SrfK